MHCRLNITGRAKGRNIVTRALLLALLCAPITLSAAAEADLPTLVDLSNYYNPAVKQLRDDVKRSIFTVKSGRPVEELPELRFYKYRVRKDDSFWTILTHASLDIDTMLSVNNLSTPKDIEPGKVIFIPNMRGVIVKSSDTRTLRQNLVDERIRPEYIYKTNKTVGLGKEFLFIPCGKLSSVERSLFLGTGFMFPLNAGRYTSGFGTRRNPMNGRYVEFHAGIDIACPRQSKVYAAREGTVRFVGYNGGYGKLVVIAHEHGYYSYYGHLSNWKVKEGDTVQRGDVIAASGNTGRTTGPHLHFEVRRGDRAVNPGYLLHK